MLHCCKGRYANNSIHMTRTNAIKMADWRVGVAVQKISTCTPSACGAISVEIWWKLRSVILNFAESVCKSCLHGETKKLGVERRTKPAAILHTHWKRPSKAVTHAKAASLYHCGGVLPRLLVYFSSELDNTVIFSCEFFCLHDSMLLRSLWWSVQCVSCLNCSSVMQRKNENKYLEPENPAPSNEFR